MEVQIGQNAPHESFRRLLVKLAYVVHTEYMTKKFQEILDACKIDYYTRWENATGKGHGTEPHLGRGSYPSTNSVIMIAFKEEAPLQALTQMIRDANAEIKRPSDRIRLFQLPLELMV